ncbi:MAG TPA: hypothetical protein VGS19_29050 [Streptosporangiaceae bacterium]|nr:hypothetical protein [Streptosporangiaceae bacterium]
MTARWRRWRTYRREYRRMRRHAIENGYFWGVRRQESAKAHARKLAGYPPERER